MSGMAAVCSDSSRDPLAGCNAIVTHNLFVAQGSCVDNGIVEFDSLIMKSHARHFNLLTSGNLPSSSASSTLAIFRRPFGSYPYRSWTALQALSIKPCDRSARLVSFHADHGDPFAFTGKEIFDQLQRTHGAVFRKQFAEARLGRGPWKTANAQGNHGVLPATAF